MAGLSIALYGAGRSVAAEALQIPCLVLEVPLPSAGGKTQVVGSFRRPLEHRPIKDSALPRYSCVSAAQSYTWRLQSGRAAYVVMPSTWQPPNCRKCRSKLKAAPILRESITAKEMESHRLQFLSLYFSRSSLARCSSCGDTRTTGNPPLSSQSSAKALPNFRNRRACASTSM